MSIDLNPSDLSPDAHLKYAISLDQEAEIVLALERGANPNLRMWDSPVLACAIESRLTGAVAEMLRRGADANAECDDGERPLHVVCRVGHDAGLEMLLKSGANPNPRNGRWETPLHLATELGDREAVHELLAFGANLHVYDDCGRSPLHNAAGRGTTDLVQTLIAAGANVRATDKNGQTPLHYASINGWVDVIDSLAGLGGGLEVADRRGRTALHHAARRDDVRGLATLVRLGADPHALDRGGNSALHTAAMFGGLSGVEALLSAGVDIDARNKLGLTPLEACGRRGRRGDSAALLLRKGAEADTVALFGLLRRAVQHAATMPGSVDLVRELIESEQADSKGPRLRPVSVTKQDLQLLEADNALSNAQQPTKTSRLQKKVSDILRMLANKGYRLSPELTAQLM